MDFSHSFCQNEASIRDRLSLNESQEDQNRLFLSECNKGIRKKFKKLDGKTLAESISRVSDGLSCLQSLCSLMSALQGYSTWVYAHSIDVALISMIFAGQLDYERHKMQELCIGALLHDIGKLLIPKRILQKPGKLDVREMEAMQRHSLLGYNLVMNLEIHADSKTIVLQHHERLDGSGYPFGLSEKFISANAGIVMVADALDAMTTCRPYRSALTMNEAIANLKKDETKYPEDILSILEQLAF